MFGLSTFAQTPFAALGGGNQFIFSITENFSPADAPSVIATFRSAISENTTLSDGTTTISDWIKIIDSQTPNWVVINNSQ